MYAFSRLAMIKRIIFRFKPWGGARAGAGRPAGPGGPRQPHVARERLPRRQPVHVTLRVLPATRTLRSARSFRALKPALAAARDRLGMRVCDFNVLGDRVHLIVEAEGAAALGRAMKGLSVRVAKALNRSTGRRGRVIADRYRAQILWTASDVRRARAFVLRDARGRDGRRAASSSRSWRELVVAPRGRLLRRASSPISAAAATRETGRAAPS
jgi:REP element-mobilizing transposase RayT